MKNKNIVIKYIVLLYSFQLIDSKEITNIDFNDDGSHQIKFKKKY